MPNIAGLAIFLAAKIAISLVTQSFAHFFCSLINNYLLFNLPFAIPM